jgi:scyllo-inositol 2-dehydrogenase (NAD+)
MVTVDAAVIGCGRMGAFASRSVQAYAPPCWLPLAHAEAIRAHPALRLTALCDVRPEALARAADAFGVTRTYTDPQCLLDDMKPVLLGVATRTIGRSEIIKAAVSVGTRALHVEKPLCNSMGELASLELIFARDDVHLTYGAIRRLLRPYQDARDLVASGAFGALLEVQVNMGRGQLFWTHPHSVDLLLFATSGARLESVSARLENVELGMDSREVMSDPWIESATFQFEGGVEGRITRAPGCDVVFSCEKGGVAVEADGTEVWIYEARGENPYPRRHAWRSSEASAQPGGTLAAVSMLVDCLRGDTRAIEANTVIKHDIVRGQRLLFAMLQSHRDKGRPVGPGEVEDGWTVWGRSGSMYA